MSRSRTFIFSIEDSEDADWTKICNFVKEGICEYIVACNDNKIINGFIKFSYAKTLTSVTKKISKNASINIVENIDIFYKENFIKSKTFFESGTPSKNKKKGNQMLKILSENDKKMNEIEENQNNLVLKHKEDKEQIKEQIEELVKLVKALKNNESEQLTQITNICMEIAKNNPSISNTNSNSNNTSSNSNNKINNKFNLNIFLNEHCKNAVNLIDFVKGIQIELQDLLLYNKVGHAEAVSKIFNNAYKKLDLTMRPIHCTDLKRETVYVRNKDEWLNDETKEISEKAMEIVSSSSFNQMKQWKEANPDYQKSQEKNIEYMKLMKNVLGGTSDAEESAEKKKIIKNLSQNAFLDKDQALTAMNP